MEIESYEHGVPCWVDLGTPDLARASAFYATLLGWDVQQAPPPAGGYSLCQLRGRAVAGIGPQQRPGPSAWLTYVSVDDGDAAAAAVREHGGRVPTVPVDVREAGRMAVLADPAGAAFGIWKAGTRQGAGLVAEPGAVRWNELVTVDVQGALDFYPAVFGWKAESHGQPGSGGYTEWKVDGRPVAGMMAKPEGTVTSPPRARTMRAERILGAIEMALDARAGCHDWPSWRTTPRPTASPAHVDRVHRAARR